MQHVASILNSASLSIIASFTSIILYTAHGQYHSYAGRLQVRKARPSNQWGVFAARSFPKGSLVLASSPLRSQNPDRRIDEHNNPAPAACAHSVQIDWDKHLLMALPARFLNHACDPNLGVGGGGLHGGGLRSGSYEFVALREIEAGEVSAFLANMSQEG